ncbi:MULTISPECIES: Cap15 family cyclic dinucleotide receptor domain-containing protein [unclassified Pseudoalteromonas]|uniref:Cap15 family cyclic dinucleotide receptor domain-containing protein n=1 Tax=unclassified Pseudoalteromonas TaxID=194690 RepID=UPI000402792A|nr:MULTISPECIES: hypothetical protein [unclassified Pseudoalteromonas]
MWSVVPFKIKLWIIIPFSILLYLLFSTVIGFDLIKSITTTASVTGISALLFGEYAWKYIYMIKPEFFEKYICPDLNGQWLAKIESNFDGETTVELPLEIKASFFSIKMIMHTNYGKSNTSICRISKEDDGSFELNYMYRVQNDRAKRGDAQSYDGAARVNLINSEIKELNGVFFTNRCWREGKNTAGNVSITKQ